jgi:hypothetical protein
LIPFILARCFAAMDAIAQRSDCSSIARIGTQPPKNFPESETSNLGRNQ